MQILQLIRQFITRLLRYAFLPDLLSLLGGSGGNLPAAYERLGEQLRQYVRPGDLLFYHGPNSPAILLYVPGVEIFP